MFRRDFWCNNDGYDRSWIAMKEADITALFLSSRTKG
jgi:hypothetical protein